MVKKTIENGNVAITLTLREWMVIRALVNMGLDTNAEKLHTQDKAVVERAEVGCDFLQTV